jgi:iron complex outermembrane recepter protein
MSKYTKKRSQNMSENLPTFKMRPIALACSALLFVASASYAKDTIEAGTDAADSVETVVVNGLRHSIETSIEAKRNNDSIIEEVSAEDIGKLPDISIAESLARLPGLAAQRVDGRASVISIRGMAPKYGVTLLNGREMVSTGDNRSVEYDQFPSELINSATVYKTPDASLAATGISGTVNLKTIRPLDFKERKISGNVRGEFNSNGELNPGTDSKGNRISASYIDQFADNTIGVALGFAHLDNPGQEKYSKSWWWGDTSKWGAPMPGLPSGTTALQGFEVGTTSTSRKRDGLMGVFEYKPNDQFHSVLDLYYSKFKQDSVQRELQADISAWSGATYANGVITNGVATGGTISGVNPIVLNRLNKREDEVFAIGWNNELKRDKWTFGTDLSYSHAKRDESNAELTAAAAGSSSLNAIISTSANAASQFIPSINFANPSQILLTQEWGRGGRVSIPKVVDELKTIRFTAKRELEGIITSVEGGVTYSDRSKNMNRTEQYYFLNNGGAPVGVSSDLLQSSGPVGAAPGVLAFDFNGVLNKYYTAGVPAALDQAPGRVWSVSEKVSTYYGKTNFDIDSKVPVRGNFGVQLVHTDQRSNGNIWTGSALAPMSGGKTYNDVLPSLNVVLDFSNIISRSTYLRLGAAKEIAHPNMEDMRAGFSGVSVSNPPLPKWSANGGNPNLDPWRATAFDVSAEKYFGNRSYVGAAFFRKNLESFVYNQTTSYDFTGFPNPGLNTPSSNIGSLNGPANGHGGYVKGSELTASLDGGLINSSLDGIGVIVSQSHTLSSLHEGNDVTKPLDGLSPIVRSLTAYYEKDGFSARISQRYRSEFQTTVRNQFGDNVASAIAPEKITDLQLGYEFSKNGPYKGVSALIQINNLTDERYATAVGSATNGTQLLPERYNTYGRQLLLGVTYKM